MHFMLLCFNLNMLRAFKGINLRLRWILLNDLPRLAGYVFENRYILQIIHADARADKIRVDALSCLCGSNNTHTLRYGSQRGILNR